MLDGKASFKSFSSDKVMLIPISVNVQRLWLFEAQIDRIIEYILFGVLLLSPNVIFLKSICMSAIAVYFFDVAF